MSRLSANNLPDGIRTPGYNLDDVSIGIVHFGIGNFHRAHQAVYIDDLLSSGATEWGVTGVSLRSSSMKDALEPQDYLYTLAVLGKRTEYRVIGAIRDVYVAPHEPQAVVNLLAKASTQIVSSTITEKGYCIASGQVDFGHPDLKNELLSLERPKTIYGFLASGIILRSKSSAPSKLTIMCCDNISGGGELLKHGVKMLLSKHSTEALAWAQSNVSFISSMVDRVCPATHDALRETVRKDSGREDAWPVSAEPFSQWIIESGFAGKRPEFDKFGAVFVDDIMPFERMKLRYLNAAHTMAATLGYLSGNKFVHEAIGRPEVFQFIRNALYKTVLPNADVPEGYNGAVYIEDVIQRFQNSNLPYANLQVGTDSSQKIQQRWFPTIDAALAHRADRSYFEFCLGAWVVFIQKALKNGVLNDPKESDFMHVEQGDVSHVAKSYLEIANADQCAFYRDADFMAAVAKHAQNILKNGVITELSGFLQT